MKKLFTLSFVLFSILSQAQEAYPSQADGKTYFEELDLSFDKLYFRVQGIAPMGSFKNVANANYGYGFDVGQYINFTRHNGGNLSIIFDYNIGATFNHLNLSGLLDNEDLEVSSSGMYTSVELSGGPGLALKLSEKLNFVVAAQVGPSLFSPPKIFIYDLSIGNNRYEIQDSEIESDRTANDIFRPRYGGTIMAEYRSVIFAIKYSYSKFRSSRSITSTPVIDGTGDYILVSGSSSLRLLVGFAF